MVAARGGCLLLGGDRLLLGLAQRPGGGEDPQPLPLGTKDYWPPGFGIVGTSYEFTFLGAQPGRWRVWAVDAQGREGFKSPWRLFTYLR